MRIDIGAVAGGVAHGVADGILDAQAGEMQALQRRADRCGVDPQRLARADPVVPPHGTSQVVEILFVLIVRLGDLPEHALGQSAVQMQAQRRGRAADQRHPAASGLHRFGGTLGPPFQEDATHLVSQQGLHAIGAGQEQGGGSKGLGHGGASAGQSAIVPQWLVENCYK